MLYVVAITLILSVGNGLIMPLSTPDGSLDVSSLLSHIALLEQTMESKASSAEITELKTQLQTTKADLKTAELKLESTMTEVNQLKLMQTDLKSAETELTAAQTELATTQAELKTTQNELKETKSDLKATQIQVAVMQSQLQSLNSPSQCNCNETNSVTQTAISSLKGAVSTLKTDVFHLQSQRNVTGHIGLNSSGGATFTRWGRTVCPGDAKIIYKGYIGGSLYSNRASSATLLCLPDHPIYDIHTAALHNSPIYGTEYNNAYSGNPFPNLYNENLPCVVCEMKTKVSAIMVPARNQCYPEWTLEYSGYLMGDGYNHASSEYICVDKDAEGIPGGHGNDNENVLYIVEGVCGSLPCPPYQNNSELTCAVCSK